MEKVGSFFALFVAVMIILVAGFAWAYVGQGSSGAAQRMEHFNEGSEVSAADSSRASLEERMAKVEGTLEQMSKRLNHVEDEIRGLRNEIGSLRGEMNSEFKTVRKEMGLEFKEIRAEMSSQFKWILGFLMGIWVTMMGTLATLMTIVLKRSSPNGKSV